MYHKIVIYAQDIIFILFITHVCLIPTTSLLMIFMSGLWSAFCTVYLVPSCSPKQEGIFHLVCFRGLIMLHACIQFQFIYTLRLFVSLPFVSIHINYQFSWLSPC